MTTAALFELEGPAPGVDEEVPAARPLVCGAESAEPSARG